MLAYSLQSTLIVINRVTNLIAFPKKNRLEERCGTVQLDFQLPIRFNLQYRSEFATEEEVATAGSSITTGGI